jgi:hypothetical protein
VLAIANSIKKNEKFRRIVNAFEHITSRETEHTDETTRWLQILLHGSCYPKSYLQPYSEFRWLTRRFAINSYVCKIATRPEETELTFS